MNERKMITIRKLLKAIRKNCLECSGGEIRGVEECPMRSCFLYPYRMGLAGLYKERGENGKK
jgi:hypothetical protein